MPLTPKEIRQKYSGAYSYDGEIVTAADSAAAPSATQTARTGYVDPLEKYRGAYSYGTPATEERNYDTGIGYAFMRGLERLRAMPDVAQGDYEELAQHYGNMEKWRMSDEDIAKFEEMRNTEGWWAKAGQLFQNPRLVMQVVAESLPMMAAPIAGAFGGGLAGGAATGGNPVGAVGGAMVGGGLGSFFTEYYNAVGEYFASKAGIDLKNPAQLKAAFEDEILMQGAREWAQARGIPIAVFDALSMGLAGRIAKPIAGATKKVAGRSYGLGGASELAMQASFGSFGEAGAQLASEGEITDELDVLLEGVAEIVPGVAEAAVSNYVNRKAEAQKAGVEDPSTSPLAALDKPDEARQAISATDIDPQTGQVVTRTGDPEIDQLDVALEDALLNLQMGIEAEANVREIAEEGAARAVERQGSRNVQMIEMEQERDQQLAKQGRLEEVQKLEQEEQMWADKEVADAEAADARFVDPVTGNRVVAKEDAPSEMVTPGEWTEIPGEPRTREEKTPGSPKYRPATGQRLVRSGGQPVEGGKPVDVIGGQPAEGMNVRPEDIKTGAYRDEDSTLSDRLLHEAGGRPRGVSLADALREAGIRGTRPPEPPEGPGGPFGPGGAAGPSKGPASVPPEIAPEPDQRDTQAAEALQAEEQARQDIEDEARFREEDRLEREAIQQEGLVSLHETRTTKSGKTVEYSIEEETKDGVRTVKFVKTIDGGRARGKSQPLTSDEFGQYVEGDQKEEFEYGEWDGFTFEIIKARTGERQSSVDALVKDPKGGSFTGTFPVRREFFDAISNLVQKPDELGDINIPFAEEEYAPKPAVEWADERLADRTYHNALDLLLSDVQPGGGVTLKPDMDQPGVTSPEEATQFSGRTPSTNPFWMQSIVDNERIGLPQVQNAVDKAKAGKRLGARQKRIVEALLDEIDNPSTYGPVETDAAESELKQLENDVKEKHGLQDLRINGTDDPNTLFVENIEVLATEQSRGVGTAAMRDIIRYADERDLNIELQPALDPATGRPKADLVRFYERLGFELLETSDRMFYTTPRARPIEEEENFIDFTEPPAAPPPTPGSKFVLDEERFEQEGPDTEKQVFSAIPPIDTKNRVAIDKQLEKEGKPYITPEEAEEQLSEWEANAIQQGKDSRSDDRGPNNHKDNFNRVIISLFDHTGKWANPYALAGYDVRTLDIQAGIDVTDFSVQFMDEMFGNFDGKEIYGILAACPCTTFANSGTRWRKDRHENTDPVESREIIEQMWGKKAAEAVDEEGNWLYASAHDYGVALVHKTMQTLEYFRPKFWVLENPEGRIENATGLPMPWRTGFQPHNFGDPYTKRTLLWGNFNDNLPTANVDPVEGSKMHLLSPSEDRAAQRSETPEGFALAFFQANNYLDTDPVERTKKDYWYIEGAIEEAFRAGVTEDQIRDKVYLDESFDPEDASIEGGKETLRQLIEEVQGGPPAPPGTYSPAWADQRTKETESEPTQLDLAETAKTESAREQGLPEGLVPREAAPSELDALADEAVKLIDKFAEQGEKNMGLDQTEIIGSVSKLKLHKHPRAGEIEALARKAISGEPEEQTPSLKDTVTSGGGLSFTTVQKIKSLTVQQFANKYDKIDLQSFALKLGLDDDGNSLGLAKRIKKYLEAAEDVQKPPSPRYSVIKDLTNSPNKKHTKELLKEDNNQMGVAPEPRRGQMDMFAPPTEAEQNLAKERERQAIKDREQPDADIGVKGDLFSEDANRQTEIKGSVKEEAVTPEEMWPPSRIEKEVAKINKEFPGANIVVMNRSDIQDRASSGLLPTLESFEEKLEDLTVNGMYNSETKTIYIFQDRIPLATPGIIRKLALHEMTHKGIDFMYDAWADPKGRMEYNQLMDDIYERVPTKYKPLLKELEVTYKLDNTKPEDRRIAAEELIANIAEREGKNSLVQKVIEFVRNFLERIGMVTPEDAWTDEDYRKLIAEAHGAIATKDRISTVTLTEEVMLGDTGEVFEVDIPASEALKEIDQRKAICRKIQACL